MKKFILSLIAVSASVMAFNYQNTPAHSYLTGAPSGSTGSPGDGVTCARSGCHTGGTMPPMAMITSDIPTSGYAPDSTYTISATVSQTGVSKFGFQVSPQDASGNQVGELVATAATQLVGVGKYITHLSSSTIATNTKTWTFSWTAPAKGSGDLTFYGAFNATNNNGARGGDNIATATMDVIEDISVGIGLNEQLSASLKTFPNPVVDQLTVEMTAAEPTTASISLIGLNGQAIAQLGSNLRIVDHFVSSFNISPAIPAGIYLLAIETGEGMVSSPVVIK